METGKTLILYHSGVGSTKRVATTLYEKLKSKTIIDIYSVEDMKDTDLIDEYDNLIIGFPTYHCSPSATICEFLNGILKPQNRKKTFIFTTCGLYSANTLRIFAKQCFDKNLAVVYSKSYRCPATDGVLIWPWIKFMHTFENNIDSKLEQDANAVKLLFDSTETKIKLPRFKLYSILNYANKSLGQSVKLKIYLIENRCFQCEKCVKNCPHKCFTTDKDRFPVHNVKNCEHCYRCIHCCPNKALTLNKNKPITKQLNEEFFKSPLNRSYTHTQKDVPAHSPNLP